MRADGWRRVIITASSSAVSSFKTEDQRCFSRKAATGHAVSGAHRVEIYVALSGEFGLCLAPMARSTSDAST